MTDRDVRTGVSAALLMTYAVTFGLPRQIRALLRKLREIEVTSHELEHRASGFDEEAKAFADRMAHWSSQ